MTKHNRLLILDLDSTLLYSSEAPLDTPYDFEAFDYHVYIRPHAREFVARCFELFAVAVWTTAVQQYAERMIEEIFPDGTSLEFLWDRSRCGQIYDPDMRVPIYIKDLAKVKKLGWSKDDILIVDDTPETAQRNYGNLVPVDGFYGDPDDNELLLLTDYLPTLAACEQLRNLEKRGWRTRVAK